MAHKSNDGDTRKSNSEEVRNYRIIEVALTDKYMVEFLENNKIVSTRVYASKKEAQNAAFHFMDN